MRNPGDWMQMPTDERILEALQSSGMILSPAVIAKNIDRSREEVTRRLTVLVEYGFVTRVERGYYEIAEPGAQYLAGELDASEIDPIED
ncbi:winged helix-turn-helix domain-containing protein [Natrinema versiforme]|uniref:Winged helix-turn-helix transcriptional regulator n=1 Tax=Natrinema versiforme TaxID=88724 RepID=A0A4P8WLS6_9EURY|nr:winged helix-turn-helix domain-containing protein [Natrinema versiforme]QCS44092.1 winged helix-turn-helix transcriptional regulator [Natrinema versiforme]